MIGGPGAFVMVARDDAELAATIRRKLVIEVSGLAPPARVVPAQFDGSERLPDRREDVPAAELGAVASRAEFRRDRKG